MDDLLIRMMRWGQQGYSCSQILLLLALEARGTTNPDLVRSMAGLAYGCGSGRATCGSLTGGCCLLAFEAADQNDPARPSGQLPMMLEDLTEWFAARVGPVHGGIACGDIVGEGGPGAARQTCAELVSATYGKVMELLAAYGVEE
jgi:hypothetical protein